MINVVGRNPCIILVTGILASGKSTVAQLLAEQFERSVHLRGDVFRKMIVNGRREMQPNGEEEALGQLRLRYRLAAQAAETYAREGFTVVVQDVVIGRVLEEFISYVRHRPFHVMVLCPDPGVVRQREAMRGKKGYGAWSPEQMDAILRSETPRVGIWLDSSDLTPEATTAEILRRMRDDEGLA